MKALLFGLLALQLVAANESAHGMRSVHQQPLPPLRSIPSPSRECMRDLIDKFGAKETISTSSSPSKTTKVMEIDISYPSFLRFFTRKYIELSKKEAVDRMEKAKEDLMRRIELAKKEYCPKFYDQRDSRIREELCISFSPFVQIGRCIFEEEFEFKEHKERTNLNRLMEDIIPFMLSPWEQSAGDWIDFNRLRKERSIFSDLFEVWAVIPEKKMLVRAHMPLAVAKRYTFWEMGSE